MKAERLVLAHVRHIKRLYNYFPVLLILGLLAPESMASSLSPRERQCSSGLAGLSEAVQLKVVSYPKKVHEVLVAIAPKIHSAATLEHVALQLPGLKANLELIELEIDPDNYISSVHMEKALLAQAGVEFQFRDESGNCVHSVTMAVAKHVR